MALNVVSAIATFIGLIISAWLAYFLVKTIIKAFQDPLVFSDNPKPGEKVLWNGKPTFTIIDQAGWTPSGRPVFTVTDGEENFLIWGPIPKRNER